MKRIIFAVLLLWTSYSFAAETVADSNAGFIVKNETVLADDGVQLATDVYLPPRDGKYPCILVRTPYDKLKQNTEAGWFTKLGYVFVIQDCRGKYYSQGLFYPLKNERRDGLATLKWIRRQKWSNGKVAGWGGSYLGFTQWAIADKLDAMTPYLTGSDFYDLIYPGGMFSLDITFKWGLGVYDKVNNYPSTEKLRETFNVLPLSVSDDAACGRDIPYMNDFVEHTKPDLFWKTVNHRGRAKCPVLSVGGWYDLLLLAQLNDFQALARKNPNHRLVIGPWCHGSQGYKNDYGGIGRTGTVQQLMLRYIDKYLKESVEPVWTAPFKDARYNLFIMERNEYYGTSQWPPKNAEFTDYYIGPDKYLSTAKPSAAGILEYVYDPANPYPSIGGTALGDGVGPALQNPNVSRTDQVVFETPPMQSPLILLGPIYATLYVSSTARCSDFFVCVQDVFPNGDIINIQEGGATVKFDRSGIKKTSFSVWATGYQYNPSHKLRVVITSSLYPRFNRNLNTGEPIFSAKTMKAAHQKIYYGPKYPSSVVLPILNIPD